MQLIDVNVLLHAVNRSAPEHVAARDWLAAALDETEPVAFVWTVTLAFLRLSTHRAVFPRPLDPPQAFDTVERWLGSPAALPLEPTPRHLPLLRGMVERAGTAGNLVADAHLAALALEHGATIVSFDRDFARFEGLRLFRPE